MGFLRITGQHRLQEPQRGRIHDVGFRMRAAREPLPVWLGFSWSLMIPFRRWQECGEPNCRCPDLWWESGSRVTARSIWLVVRQPCFSEWGAPGEEPFRGKSHRFSLRCSPSSNRHGLAALTLGESSIANQPFDDKHEFDFHEWKKEIFGEETSNSRRDQDRLPFLSGQAELSEEEQLKLRWYSALLDAPYVAKECVGAERSPWNDFMRDRARHKHLVNGECYQAEGYDDYIQRWESVGIGSDLYLLIHASLKRAVETSRSLHTSDLAKLNLEARLDELHLGPEDGGKYGRSLVPEDWEALPYLMTGYSPSQAIRRIIDAGL